MGIQQGINLCKVHLLLAGVTADCASSRPRRLYDSLLLKYV